MYIPKRYEGTNMQEAIAFMQRFSFASIITSIENIPTATHLPFVVFKRGDELILSAHFAKANNHWKHISANENLIIFSEPHAYISPTHYNHEENVPTWNYMSVHAYGKAKLIEEPSELVQLLESMIDSFEASYRAQWEQLSPDYKAKMVKGIIGFEIVVTKLQFKEKLSQNKQVSEQEKIIESLSDSQNGSEKLLAEYMQKKQ